MLLTLQGCDAGKQMNHLKQAIKEAKVIGSAGIVSAFLLAPFFENGHSVATESFLDHVDASKVSYDILELTDAINDIPMYEDYSKFDWGRDLEISKDDLFCLQQNIYFESRGEPVKGQEKVAWVTLNRVKSSTWPDNACDVVWQPSQFSWTNGRNKGVVPRFNNAGDKRSWKEAAEIARKVVTEYMLGYPDLSSGSDHFYSVTISPPSWAHTFNQTGRTGNHIFFSMK